MTTPPVQPPRDLGPSTPHYSRVPDKYLVHRFRSFVIVLFTQTAELCSVELLTVVLPEFNFLMEKEKKSVMKI